MAVKVSKIASDLLPDDPLVQDAAYQFDATDRQWIDLRQRSAEIHLSESLINGVHASWYTVDPASAALAMGQVVATSTAAPGRVSLADAAALTAGCVVLGVALRAASPGAKVQVSHGGLLSPNITGLAASAGFARVSSTGSVERVSSLTTGDTALGTVDPGGWLAIQPLSAGLTTGGVLAASVPAVAGTIVERGASAEVYGAWFASEDGGASVQPTANTIVVTSAALFPTPNAGDSILHGTHAILNGGLVTTLDASAAGIAISVGAEDGLTHWAPPIVFNVGGFESFRIGNFFGNCLIYAVNGVALATQAGPASVNADSAGARLDDGVSATIVAYNGDATIAAGGAVSSSSGTTTEFTSVGDFTADANSQCRLVLDESAATAYAEGQFVTIRGYAGGLPMLSVDTDNSIAYLQTTVHFYDGAVASITQDAYGGTGTAAGSALSITAQGGQAQTGLADNNDGGTLSLSGGAAGTGGSGAAGTQGILSLSGGQIHAETEAGAIIDMSGLNISYKGKHDIQTTAGVSILQINSDGGGKIGFFNTVGTTKQAVTGSRGSNAALASLITILANHGLITDSSS